MAVVSVVSDEMEQYVTTRIERAIAENNAQWETVWDSSISTVNARISGNSRDMDVAWLVICGAMVFFMQAGFAMLEAGIVHKKNVTNILFKVDRTGPHWLLLTYFFWARRSLRMRCLCSLASAYHGVR